LVGYARSLRSLLDEAVAAVSSAVEEPSSPLVIGASTTIAAWVLPTLLAQFRAQYRQVPLQVRVGNTQEVMEDVRAARVPFGLVEGHARAAGIRLEPFVDDEIVPVVGRDSAFTLRRARDLENVPLLWREAGSGTRAVVERALRAAGITRRDIRALDVELGSTGAVLGAAAAGLGVAFVSRWSVRAHLAANLLQVVSGLNLVIRRTFRWALPAGGLAGPAARFYAFAQRSPPR
jgi:DNA-binding transcriptional LysR family regulator